MRVVIADDERYIREGIRELIPWESLACRLVGEGKNGEEALQLIHEFKPQLCIIDIKMPVKDGLYVIESCYNQRLATRFIVLSGHRDFDYAKRAIACKVQAYILKPVDELILIEKIKEIQEEIFLEEKMRQSLKKQELRQREADILEFLSTKQNTNGEQLLIEALEGYDEGYQVIMSHPIDAQSEHEYIELFNKYVGNSALHFRKEEQMVSIVCKQFFYGCTQKLDNLRQAYQEQVGIKSEKLVITYGEKVSSVEKLPESYHQASIIQSQPFLYIDESGVRGYDSIEDRQGNDGTRKIDAKKMSTVIFRAVSLNEEKLINDSLEEGLDALYRSGYSTFEMMAYYMHLYVDVLRQVGQKFHDFDSSTFLNTDILNQIVATENLQKLHGAVKYQLYQLSHALHGRDERSLVDKMLEYMRMNYEKDIHIEEIAKELNYSSGHLGKQFRIETGEYFNTVLDKIRISACKKLLTESEMKLYEIALATGFSEPDYMTVKFKKYVGCSPKEFRRQIIKENIPDH